MLFTPGEEAAGEYTAYLTNKTLIGLYAQEIKGAALMIERKVSSFWMKMIWPILNLLLDRYWGESSPYSNLTAENLQYLTLENSIADLTYFARNVKLPFDTNGSSNAQNAVFICYSAPISYSAKSTDVLIFSHGS